MHTHSGLSFWVLAEKHLLLMLAVVRAGHKHPVVCFNTDSVCGDLL